MTVSYSNVTPSFLPMWVAKEAGIFEQNGLDVEPQLISGGQVLMASLISGQTPIGTVGGSEVLSAAAAGADLVVLGILVPVSPWQFWTSPDIKTADQVKGKKLAIVTVGGSADIALRIGLPKLGIDPDKDMTIVATGSTENLNAALLNGAVDGAATHPPDTTVFKAKGFNVLFDLAEQKVASADTAMVTQRSFLNSNRDTVQRYIDSIVQGIAREKTDKPFAVKVLKNYMKLTDDEAASDAYDYYSTRIRPWQPLATPEQFAEAKAALGAKNDKVRDFDVTKIIDNSFIQSAASRGLAGGP
jgi:NitT/TauT family transport system substrate-binding protein